MYIFDSNISYLQGEGVIDAFREVDNVGYIETDETEYNEDYEENLTKAYAPVYIVAGYYADNTNPDEKEYDNIDFALSGLEKDRPYTDIDSYEPYNELLVQFETIWIDENGDEVYREDDRLTNEDIDDCPLIQTMLGKYYESLADYSFSSKSEMRDDTQEELSEKFAEEYDGKEYDFEGHIVYLRAESAFSVKYSDVEVVDKETDEVVGYIKCRFANHSYNPANNKEEGAFISVVVNSNDPTKDKFHGMYNLRYDDEPDVEDIMEDLDERMEEIMYDGSFLISDNIYGL